MRANVNCVFVPCRRKKRARARADFASFSINVMRVALTRAKRRRRCLPVGAVYSHEANFVWYCGETSENGRLNSRQSRMTKRYDARRRCFVSQLALFGIETEKYTRDASNRSHRRYYLFIRWNEARSSYTNDRNDTSERLSRTRWKINYRPRSYEVRDY